MPRLDPDELRAYAARDWAAPERLARADRAAATVEARSAVAVALWEAARRTRPEWPTEADRREDLAAHERLAGLLRRAGAVGTDRLGGGPGLRPR